MTKIVVPRLSVIPGERRDLYTIYDGFVYRFNGSNGKVIWQTRIPHDKQSNRASVYVANGVVYAVLSFDIYALDMQNGEQIWHVINPTEKAYFWSVVANGRVYLYSRDETFSALNAADGSMLWHNPTFMTGDGNGYGFSVLNGHVYTELQTNSGRDVELFTLDGATGEVRWSVPLPTHLMSHPLVAEGVVYIASHKFLFALKEQSGESIWEQEVPNTSLYNPYLANGILYAESPAIRFSEGPYSRNYSSSLPHIVALNAQTGQLLWTVGLGYSRLTGESLGTGADHHYLCLPIVDGLLLAHFSEYEKIENTFRPGLPARFEYTGIVSMVGLDAQTGRVAQSYPIHQGTTWGAILDGIVYLVESVDLPQEPGVFTAKRAFTESGPESPAPLRPGMNGRSLLMGKGKKGAVNPCQHHGFLLYSSG